MREPQFIRASDHSVLVPFGEEIALEHHESVVRLATALLADPKPFIKNIHPAYSSVLVSFDAARTAHAEVEDYIVGVIKKLSARPMPTSREVEVPVCYGGEFGLDLPDVAQHNGLSVNEVTEIHSSAAYKVYFLGFSPGFPYMGGMSERIATPRLPRPRTHVPAGSVAIGGAQTGIYPLSSPGGWRIIGRTPLRLFNPAANPPTLLQMGDVVRFREIGREEYDRLSAADLQTST